MADFSPSPPRRPVAIVTGASRDSGIGAAVCLALAAQGADIFFTYWRAHDRSLYGEESEGPEVLHARLLDLGVRCEQAEVDLSQPDAATRIMDAVETRLGPASILVNNAAHDDTHAPFDQLDANTLDAYYAVNIRGTILLSVEFARRYSRAPTGHIINLTSGQGIGSMPGKLPYAATKGAIEAFTVTLAAEVAERNITVNAVDPGPTDTGWITADHDLGRELLATAPFGRVGRPADAAHVIAFLASEQGAWITGQIIHSRGGF